MEDYRLTQSGQEVQNILDGSAMQVDLTAETERATEAEQTLQGNIDAEETRAEGAEGTLQDNINAEEARAKAAEKQNADDIDAIEEKIPSGASSSNKLATEEYVADAVATATATFRGTYNLVSDLHLNVTATEQQIAASLAGAISTADNNDYCFILVPTSSETPTEIKEIDRYKFNGTAWAFEYKLNNSGFTAAQWAAINSGITSGDVAKLAALPTNAQLTTLLAGLQSDIDGEEARAKGAEGTLQDNIDAEEARAKAAEKQNADDIDAIEDVLPETASSENKVATESEINSLSAAIEAILLLIPSAATSLNKLADKAFVNSSIATATATFRGTYNLVNDLGLTTSATHAQIATALAGAILTADNNDYAFVQIPTSDAMPTEIAKTERYKFNGTAWEYEYDLNNSGFTADQWAAINSGITQALVTKLSALPTNAELTTELGTLTSGINTINQKIPNAASQANKLVDTAAMESYIVQVLDVLTVSYNVTSTDGHVTLSIEQVDGKITSVTLTTSDIASAAALNLKASQADLTALANRLTTAEGNITTLGGRMATAEGNITSLGGRMTTAEGNITSLGGRMTTAEGNITSLGVRVSTNENDIANLQQLYNDLQQSKPVPVTALPSTGQQQGVIYRLAGTTSYSDYMWNGSSWVLMATYNNAIDDIPTPNSNNLVKSGGVSIFGFSHNGTINTSKNWLGVESTTYGHYVLEVTPAFEGLPYSFTAGSVGACVVAFLNVYNPVEGQPAGVIGKIVTIATNATASGTIPSGTKYIFILNRSAAQNRMLSKMFINDVDLVKENAFVSLNGIPNGYKVKQELDNDVKSLNYRLFSLGGLPNVDSENNTLTFYSETTITIGNNNYTIPANTVVDLTVSGTVYSTILFHKADKTFVTIQRTQDFNPLTDILFGFAVTGGNNTRKRYWFPFNYTVDGSDEEKGIITLNSEVELTTKIRNLKVGYVDYGVSTNYPPVLSLVHFSDLHSDNTNLLRIKDFVSKYTSLIDDVIQTGDLVGAQITDGVPTDWPSVPEWMSVIGNHDATIRVDGQWVTVSSQQSYDEIFAPYIADWNVVQPSGAGQSDYYPCYYYKDYTLQKVRLIVLDNMQSYGGGPSHWDSTQKTWFENTLTDAKTNNLHVVVAMHYPPFATVHNPEIPFDSISVHPDGSAFHASSEIANAVKDFIDGGGYFVCYLTGHTHCDYFGVAQNTNWNNQLCIGIAAAGRYAGSGLYGDCDRTLGTIGQDCFNVVGIDSESGTVKLIRVGLRYDKYLRRKNTLCWDYKNNVLVYTDK